MGNYFRFYRAGATVRRWAQAVYVSGPFVCARGFLAGLRGEDGRGR